MPAARETALDVDAEAARSETVVPPDDVEDAALLTVIQSLPPAAFERLCGRLLTEWGFEQVEVGAVLVVRTSPGLEVLPGRTARTN